MVAVAGLVGLCATVVGGLLFWLAGPVAGALLGGVLIAPALWWLTRGWGLRAVLAAAQPEEVGAERREERLLRMGGLQGFLILKLICVGLLVHAGAVLWFLVTWLIVGAVFAEEMNAAVGSRNGVAVAAPRHWLVVAIAGALAGGLMGQFMSVLLLVVLAWLALPMARRQLLARIDLRGMPFTWLLAEVAETAILLLATLLTFAR
jgi:hypothetical protein